MAVSLSKIKKIQKYHGIRLTVLKNFDLAVDKVIEKSEEEAVKSIYFRYVPLFLPQNEYLVILSR